MAPLDEELAIEAAELGATLNLPMADSCADVRAGRAVKAQFVRTHCDGSRSTPRQRGRKHEHVPERAAQQDGFVDNEGSPRRESAELHADSRRWGGRGFAHAGVLRALEHFGCLPSAIVGVSIGSILAAAYSLRKDWYTALVDFAEAGFPAKDSQA
jgi:hypothetical protein